MRPTDVRCPQCGALVRAGTAWCTLCHADLRPGPAQAPMLDDELVARPLAVELDVASVDPTPSPDPAPSAEPARGKHARPTPPTDAVAEQMVAELRRQSSDPTLARLGGRMSDPGTRLTVMVAGTVGLAAVLLGGYAVLGLIFG